MAPGAGAVRLLHTAFLAPLSPPGPPSGCMAAEVPRHDVVPVSQMAFFAALYMTRLPSCCIASVYWPLADRRTSPPLRSFPDISVPCTPEAAALLISLWAVAGAAEAF